MTGQILESGSRSPDWINIKNRFGASLPENSGRHRQLQSPTKITFEFQNETYSDRCWFPMNHISLVIPKLEHNSKPIQIKRVEISSNKGSVCINAESELLDILKWILSFFVLKLSVAGRFRRLLPQKTDLYKLPKTQLLTTGKMEQPNIVFATWKKISFFFSG